jgi:hypothetical protein
MIRRERIVDPGNGVADALILDPTRILDPEKNKYLSLL